MTGAGAERQGVRGVAADLDGQGLIGVDGGRQRAVVVVVISGGVEAERRADIAADRDRTGGAGVVRQLQLGAAIDRACRDFRSGVAGAVDRVDELGEVRERTVGGRLRVRGVGAADIIERRVRPAGIGENELAAGGAGCRRWNSAGGAGAALLATLVPTMLLVTNKLPPLSRTVAWLPNWVVR